MNWLLRAESKQKKLAELDFTDAEEGERGAFSAAAECWCLASRMIIWRNAICKIQMACISLSPVIEVTSEKSWSHLNIRRVVSQQFDISNYLHLQIVLQMAYCAKYIGNADTFYESLQKIPVFPLSLKTKFIKLNEKFHEWLSKSL